MIYLDNNATTYPLPEVICAVRKALEEVPGNPSSAHPLGVQARRALESARSVIANGLGTADASQITFTSCGTESINTAFSLLISDKIEQLVVSAVEHSAVLHAVRRWADGRKIHQIPVSKEGALDFDALQESVSIAPSLVSLCLANNETGVITDIEAAAGICRRAGSLLHVDAVQAAGKIPFKVFDLQADACSFSAHKFHGPRGCGILFIHNPEISSLRGHPLLPGSQENGLRGGTHNLPAIIGTATAVEALPKKEAHFQAMILLRDRLEKGLLARIPAGRIHGRKAARLANTTSFYCPKRNAGDLVIRLGQAGLAVSAGAACTTGGAPSHVIQAMGYSPERANGTLRFSLSRFTTQEEIDQAVGLVARIYENSLPTSRCT